MAGDSGSGHGVAAMGLSLKRGKLNEREGRLRKEKEIMRERERGERQLKNNF